MTADDNQPIRRYFDPKGPNYVGSTESEVRKADREEVVEHLQFQSNISYVIGETKRLSKEQSQIKFAWVHPTFVCVEPIPETPAAQFLHGEGSVYLPTTEETMRAAFADAEAFIRASL